MKTHEITYKEPESEEECSFVECFECIIPLRGIGEFGENCFCREKLGNYMCENAIKK